ncbi:MAG: DUF169 domain-containing protein [Candidatus Helarchaeota archaeon]
MSLTHELTNKEIEKRFLKYMKLRYMPLGMFFSSELPKGKVRYQGKIINRCIVGHIFKAASRGKISIIMRDKGCPGGQYWSGFRKKLPRGWALFLSKGRDDVLGGRAERFKKDPKLAVKMLKDPGPVKLPEKTNYIVYQRLKQIPDDQKIEFVLFFVEPNDMAKIITLINYARHVPHIIRASAGSGCMSLLVYPLNLEKYPNADAVMGIWDCFARRNIPRNIISIALRRWLVEEMAINMPESFLAHIPPFTIKGEIIHFLKKYILKKSN